MKKCVSLLVLLPLVLTSCGTKEKDFMWQEHTTDKTSYYFMSEKLQKFDTSFDFNALNSAKNKLLNVIRSKGNNKQISDSYSNYRNLTRKLNEILNIVTVYYYGASTDYVEQYNNIYDVVVNCQIFETSLFKEAANSSNDVKMYFFGTLDQNEINKVLSQSETNKITAELTSELDSISDDFNLYFSTLEDYRTEEALKKGIETYVEYVKIANQLAKANNFNTYLDYAYKNVYNRDYSPLDGYNFAQNVKSSISEVGFEYKPYLPKDDGSNDYKKLTNLMNVNFNNKYCDGAMLFDKYVQFMGSNYVDTYNSLWRDGYYFFSNRDDSLGTAFILADPSINYEIAFFSKNMQNISSVVHEFGHYYAMHNNKKNNYQPYDILETHSQANEYVFANYVKNNYNNKFAKYYGDQKFMSDVSYLIDFAYIIDVENYAYNESNLTVEKLTNFINGLSEEYKELNIKESLNYWLYPCICSACYYISYATSSLEAMQFYLFDLNDAKSKYIRFCNNGEEEPAVQKWTKAGLKSPFDKNVFDLVVDYLKVLN